MSATANSFGSRRTRATSSKLYASRMRVSGGGGGLMLDLTPDFLVTLSEHLADETWAPIKVLQCRETVEVTPGLIRLCIPIGIKPFESLLEY
jgi:hypothetical protein